ncbi:MAG TPA: hypothetical protein VHR45_05365 [Thermoanaerobaculia bacterium]|nr:hypothetical protein [Thermoanaerobaculia bacterium]
MFAVRPQPCSRRQALRLGLCAWLTAAAGIAPPPAGGPAAPTATPPETFAEKVLVREIELVVELPPELKAGRREALQAADFVVVEDGVLRRVVKAEPLAGGKGVEPTAWTVVLYLDKVLAGPDTAFLTSLALAERAAQLAALGGVEIVVADPRPRVTLAATRDAQRLEQALTALVRTAKEERDRAAQARVTAAPLDAAAVRRQEDRLLYHAASHSAAGPRALLLIADGFDAQRPGEAALESSSAESARALAAYGWVTIAASIRKIETSPPHHETPDLERLRQSAAGGSVPPVILPEPSHGGALSTDEAINVFLAPSSATLHGLASATGGTIAGLPGQLTAALTALERRWHLFYLAPDPADGRPRPVEARLSPEGKMLRAPGWRRSSTPEGLAAARLRLLLAGDAARGGLRLSATLARRQAAEKSGSPEEAELRLTLAPFTTGDSTAAGPFRVSTAATAAAGGVEVRHILLVRPDLTESGWTERVPLALPAGSRQVAVEVEDLAHQSWGALTLDIPAR